MTAAMDPPVVARSNDGSLIAIHHPPPISSSSSTDVVVGSESGGSGGSIRCYDGNASDGSLKFTLRLPQIPSSMDVVGGGGRGDDAPHSSLVVGVGGGGLRKLVFASPSHDYGSPRYLCGMMGACHIHVWDLERGVLSTTIDIRRDDGGKKGGNDASILLLRDLATSPADGRLYALLHSTVDDRCRLYEYDLESTNPRVLVRKIKVGSATTSTATATTPSSSSSSFSSSLAFGMTIASTSPATARTGDASSSSAANIIVIRSGGTLRVIDSITGSRLCKVDVYASDDISPPGGGGASTTHRANALVPLVASRDGRHVVVGIDDVRAALYSHEPDRRDDDDARDGSAADEKKRRRSRLRAMAVLYTGDDGSSAICHLDVCPVTEDGEGGRRVAILAYQRGGGGGGGTGKTTVGGGTASLFEVDDDSSTTRTIPRVDAVARMITNHVSGIALVDAAFHPRMPRESLSLLFHRAHPKSRGGSAAASGTTFLPMETLACAGLRGTVIVGDVMSSKSGDDSHDVASRKRKASSSIGGAIALAPGDQGREASLAADLSSSTGHGNNGKRTGYTGRDDDDEEDEVKEDEGDFFDDVDEEDGEFGQSIADRLALLSSAMEESDEDEYDNDDYGEGRGSTDKSKFKSQSATSETLTTLLMQALASNDPTQLNVALQVTDRRLVEGTVRSLQSLDAERVGAAMTAGYIQTLMAHLVRRMARRHSLVMPLGVWVKAILAATARSATHQVMARDENDVVGARMAREGREMAAKLGPLKNFLNERVECFPQLLRLEGRLALLNQQL